MDIACRFKMKTIQEQLAIAKAQAAHCLNGGERQPHQTDADILWLMGWADNEIEAQLIEQKMERMD